MMQPGAGLDGAPKKRPVLPLAAYLVGLVLAVFLPAFAVGLSSAWHAAEGQRVAAEQGLRDTARALALAMDREFGALTAGLAAFATSPAFGHNTATAPDRLLLHAQASRVAAQLGGTVGLAERDGTHLLSTWTEPDAQLPRVASLDAVERAFATGQPAVGNLVTGSVSHRPVFSVAVPIRDAEGRLTMAAIVAPDVERLRGLLAAQGLPAGTFAAVTDANGRIVARSDAEHARVIGLSIFPDSTAARTGRTGGLYRATATNGVEHVFAFRALSAASGWTVVVAQDAASLDAAWRRMFRTIGAGAALVLLVGGILAMLTTSRILRPLRDLSRHAGAIVASKGSLPRVATVLPPAPIAELELLRRGFAAAEDAMRRRLEAAQRSAETFARLVEDSPFGIYVVDADFRVAHASASSRAAFASVDPLIGRDFAEAVRAIWPEPLASEVIAKFRHTLDTGETYATGHTHEQRTDRDATEAYEWRLERITLADGRPGVVCYFYDLTERQHAEERLRESESALRFALNAGRLGAWTLNLATDEITTSETFRTIFGRDPRVPMTRAELRAAIHPEDIERATRAAERSIAERADYDTEYRVVTPSGVVRWVAVRGQTAYAEDGTPLRLAGVILDITEHKRSEQRQMLLAREVDHRAKNVLAVAQSLVRLTATDNPQSFAKVIEGRIAALARAHTLLANEHWEGAGVQAVLEEELAAYRNDRRITLSGPPARLLPNAVQPFAMVVHELATNAAKYGALSVRPGKLHVTWSREADGSLVLIWIEQGGPKLPGEPPRLGFGSNLIESLVENGLSGTIEKEWHPVGLRCVLTMPAGQLDPFLEDASLDSSLVEPADKDRGLTYRLAGKRILLVEDEPLVAMEMQRMLAALGCIVVGPAMRFEQALRLASEHNGRLDAVVLDYNLRGHAATPVAKLIAAQSVPIIWTTGYNELPDRHYADEASVVLRKPLGTGVLEDALRRVLSQHGRGGTVAGDLLR